MVQYTKVAVQIANYKLQIYDNKKLISFPKSTTAPLYKTPFNSISPARYDKQENI